ncbi:glutamine-hydrolyzing GMP synthase [Candidatus Peregrinibacteria bacterium]|nr:glutamine-hydrolyzing GMP synthase [Candidatus Peregrinibacteria bacterium]
MPSIAVLDFGAQYAHLIANRIRRLHAHSEIFPNDISAEKLQSKNIGGIILSGGPMSVFEENSPQVDPKIFELGIPVLGVCYGHQLIGYALGGKVVGGKVKEFGKSEFTPLKKEGIFQNFPDVSIAWMSHGDEIVELPKGFEIAGKTDDCAIAAMADFRKNIYGVQFHPEVTHTEWGMLLYKNFIHICGLENTWKIEDFLESEIAKIREQAEGKKVFLLTSGGVDSSVTFALLEKALGKNRVYGLFVDHGLLRKNEVKEVEEMLASAGFANLHVAREADRFLRNLKGVTDPEQKRKIIGNTFLDVQAEVSEKLNLNPDEWILGQGTIYPDTIESGGTRHASKIKTHHNRVERIQKLIEEGKIIEPVKDLYKDEVREVGRKLGLSEKIVARHPFPGPGLGVRILCVEKEDPLPNAEKIEQEIETKFPEISVQILPIKSVGVQGDARTYRHPLAIFPKKELSWKELDNIATAIPNAWREVNRVILCISHSHRLENPVVQKSSLTKNRIEIAQEADAIVRKILDEESFDGKDRIWQFPVVLVPVSFGEGESIILRPIESTEAMTASFARMPMEVVQRMSNRILEITNYELRITDNNQPESANPLREPEGSSEPRTAYSRRISAVFFDITNKPPGTIEWE